MSEILVVYYSRQGSTAALARQVCRGVDGVPGMRARLRTVRPISTTTQRIDPPVPDDGPPYAEQEDLLACSGLILGSPTRFGNMAAQMRNFLDQTGKHWMSGALIGKVGSVFASTASQHGGQETTITSFHTTLLHQGMIIVGLPYAAKELLNMKEITGGTPYGATTLSDVDGSRQPTENELAGARFQGRHVAQIAARLSAGV